MKKLVLLLAVLFVVNGCGKNNEVIRGGSTKADRFTRAFVRPSGFVIDGNPGRRIVLRFNGNEIEGRPNDEDNSTEYRELADKFGDTVTDQSYRWNIDVTGPLYATSSPVTVDIYTTNKAFDKNHDISVSLNDIAIVNYKSYKDLILIYDHELHNSIEYEKAEKQMIIKEFNEALLTFYDSVISIELPAPDQMGDYDFDVIVTMDGGKAVKESITISFDE